jgi:hypothetical protein
VLSGEGSGSWHPSRRRSKQLIERQQRKHIDLNALPESDCRFLVEVDRNPFFERAPDEPAWPASVDACSTSDVTVGRLRDILEAERDLARARGSR